MTRESLVREIDEVIRWTLGSRWGSAELGDRLVSFWRRLDPQGRQVWEEHLIAVAGDPVARGWGYLVDALGEVGGQATSRFLLSVAEGESWSVGQRAQALTVLAMRGKTGSAMRVLVEAAVEESWPAAHAIAAHYAAHDPGSSALAVRALSSTLRESTEDYAETKLAAFLNAFLPEEGERLVSFLREFREECPREWPVARAALRSRLDQDWFVNEVGEKALMPIRAVLEEL